MTDQEDGEYFEKIVVEETRMEDNIVVEVIGNDGSIQTLLVEVERPTDDKPYLGGY